ncbi:MAG: hypothetical protein AVDCRST_MAG27-1402, partial [uncultured Craurococcus sp.]
WGSGAATMTGCTRRRRSRGGGFSRCAASCCNRSGIRSRRH